MPRKKEDNPTKKEIEVLELRIAGCSNQQTADELFISIPAVKSRINKLFGKLGVDNIADAWKKCAEQGYVKSFSEKFSCTDARNFHREEKEVKDLAF